LTNTEPSLYGTAITAAHLEPSAEELELADLVLASVMQDVARHPEGHAFGPDHAPNLDHPSFAPIVILQQVEALQIHQAEPAAFADVYRQLGDWYRDRAEQQSAMTTLQIGIRAYELAWQFLEPEAPAVPEILNDIGNLHWMLSRLPEAVSTSLANLQEAIMLYQRALDKTDTQRYPQTCAMLQNNLGAAYSDLAQRRDPIDNLHQSIQAYQAALEARPAAVDPRRYAATQNNLGTAYWHLANQPATHYDDLQGHLEQAMAAYETAIGAVTDGIATFDLAATHNNLASAYYQAATQRHAKIDTPTRTTYLDKALQNHLVALQGWQAQPDFQDAALNGVIQTVRACHEHFGVQAQAQALSHIPPQLLPVVMKEL
jgi:tetratricopeptide (TPR) repeat protein